MLPYPTNLILEMCAIDSQLSPFSTLHSDGSNTLLPNRPIQSICLTKTTYVDDNDDDIKSVFWPTTANPWTMWKGQIGLVPILKNWTPITKYNEIFIVDDRLQHICWRIRLVCSLSKINNWEQNIGLCSQISNHLANERNREELIKSQNNLIMNSVLSIITAEWLVN